MRDPDDVVDDGEDVNDDRHHGGLHLVGSGDAHHEAEEEHEVYKHGALRNIG